MCFQLVPKLVTINDLTRRNGPYVVLFRQFGRFGAHYIKVV